MKFFKPLFIIGTLTLPFTGTAQRKAPSATAEDHEVYYQLLRNDGPVSNQMSPCRLLCPSIPDNILTGAE